MSSTTRGHEKEICYEIRTYCTIIIIIKRLDGRFFYFIMVFIKHTVLFGYYFSFARVVLGEIGSKTNEIFS